MTKAAQERAQQEGQPVEQEPQAQAQAQEQERLRALLQRDLEELEAVRELGLWEQAALGRELAQAVLKAQAQALPMEQQVERVRAALRSRLYGTPITGAPPGPEPTIRKKVGPSDAAT